MSRLALCAVFALVAASAICEEPKGDRILLPVVAHSAPGGFGSIWHTQTWAVNLSTDVQRGQVPQNCPVLCPDEFALAPGEAVLIPVDSAPSGRQGRVLYVEHAAAVEVGTLLWTGDTVRAQLPTPRQDEFFSSSFFILGVSIRRDWRYALRVYSLDGKAGEVRVRFTSAIGGGVAGETRLLIEPGPTPFDPGFGQILQLKETFPLLDPPADFDHQVHVGFEPIAMGQRLWAFISATDNATQEVVIYTP